MTGPLSPITEEEVAAVAARLRSCRVTIAGNDPALRSLTLSPYPLPVQGDWCHVAGCFARAWSDGTCARHRERR